MFHCLHFCKAAAESGLGWSLFLQVFKKCVSCVLFALRINVRQDLFPNSFSGGQWTSVLKKCIEVLSTSSTVGWKSPLIPCLVDLFVGYLSTQQLALARCGMYVCIVGEVLLWLNVGYTIINLAVLFSVVRNNSLDPAHPQRKAITQEACYWSVWILKMMERKEIAILIHITHLLKNIPTVSTYYKKSFWGTGNTVVKRQLSKSSVYKKFSELLYSYIFNYRVIYLFPYLILN